jgi:hypothetical protein
MSVARAIRLGLVAAAVGFVAGCGGAGGGGLANARYVAPTGDDLADGSLSSPWRTLAHAAASVVAGDTVYLRQGVYTERLLPTASGTQDAWITFASYTGETATIDGTGVEVIEDTGLVDLSGRSYIRIQGLRVTNSQQAGIYAEGASHLAIENNRTYNTGSSGIGIWASSDVAISGNEVELACTNGRQESLTVAGTNGFDVYGNEVHRGGTGPSGGEGICLKDGSSNGRAYQNLVHDGARVGIYVDAWDKHTHDIEVYRNTVHTMAAFGIAVASEAGWAAGERARLQQRLRRDGRHRRGAVGL